ncbi:ChbG/HpnK family deacetylase [Paenibacillus sp. PAMC 26794]|uniref:carbohydrate deacetylase n=1 Tax=Paenibacillus sp. PAMC 26794 TaxID=1257080 RepID=UPI000307956A|nr:ChbG/HpnK family deacetylase [Paenibacillus sp. PAMC 26794]
MSRQVIINADDFGLSPSVNQGIIQAYLAGGITSTSMMVNMPGLDHAVSSACSLPDLGIGLHFNLTYGRPVSEPSQVPSLVNPDGSFYKGDNVTIRDIADIAKELDAQWNAFIQTSFTPTHLDSHQLLHQNDPRIYKIMAEKAVRENIPLRRSQIRHSIPDLSAPRMTDTILLDTYEGPEGLRRLLHHLSSLRAGVTEIVCHPGYVDDVLRDISNWLDIREHELKVFINPIIPRTLQELGIIPINYKTMNAIPDAYSELLPIRTPIPIPGSGTLTLPVISPTSLTSTKKTRYLRQRLSKQQRIIKALRMSSKRRAKARTVSRKTRKH